MTQNELKDKLKYIYSKRGSRLTADYEAIQRYKKQVRKAFEELCDDDAAEVYRDSATRQRIIKAKKQLRDDVVKISKYTLELGPLIDRLEKEERTCLELIYRDGMSFREIEEAGIYKDKTAREYVDRAMAKLMRWYCSMTGEKMNVEYGKVVNHV